MAEPVFEPQLSALNRYAPLMLLKMMDLGFLIFYNLYSMFPGHTWTSLGGGPV